MLSARRSKLKLQAKTKLKRPLADGNQCCVRVKHEDVVAFENVVGEVPVPAGCVADFRHLGP